MLAVGFGRRFANRHAAAALATILSVASSPAHARATSPVFVALDYDGVPAGFECPAVEEFRGTVERQLGYDPFRATADRRVAIEIARKEGRFNGRIRWSDAAGNWVGERRLSSRRLDCGGIAASVAFAVAVQIQLLAEMTPESPPPEPAPPERAIPPPPAIEHPTAPSPPAGIAGNPKPAPAAKEPWLRLAMGLGPSVAVGLTPQVTGLGRLFVTGAVGWFSLELAGDVALPVTRRDAGATGFSLDRMTAGAAACGHAAAVAACVTGTLGRLQAHGFGVDSPASPAGYFSQAGARVMATQHIAGRYFVAERVEGLVMLSSSTVTLNQVVAWTTPRVGGVLGIDLGARFF